MTNLPNRARAPHTTTLRALFATYLVLLAWIVLWKLDVPWVGGVQRTIKLVPFVSDGTDGASDPIEVAANVVLFVPFGFYLGLLAPRWAWWRAAGTIAVTSLLLEVTQYVLAIGSSDVTDVIANTAGGLAGLGLVAVARRGLRPGTRTVVMRVCSIGTVLAVLACCIVVASPLRHLPGPDVSVDHRQPMPIRD